MPLEGTRADGHNRFVASCDDLAGQALSGLASLIAARSPNYSAITLRAIWCRCPANVDPLPARCWRRPDYNEIGLSGADISVKESAGLLSRPFARRPPSRDDAVAAIRAGSALQRDGSHYQDAEANSAPMFGRQKLQLSAAFTDYHQRLIVTSSFQIARR
jgi:hypothetical protein